eukprot:349696-Chlamydomonas_euryale.AAC.2
MASISMKHTPRVRMLSRKASKSLNAVDCPQRPMRAIQLPPQAHARRVGHAGDLGEGEGGAGWGRASSVRLCKVREHGEAPHHLTTMERHLSTSPPYSTQ